MNSSLPAIPAAKKRVKKELGITAVFNCLGLDEIETASRLKIRRRAVDWEWNGGVGRVLGGGDLGGCGIGSEVLEMKGS